MELLETRRFASFVGGIFRRFESLDWAVLDQKKVSRSSGGSEERSDQYVHHTRSALPLTVDGGCRLYIAEEGPGRGLESGVGGGGGRGRAERASFHSAER